MPPLPQSISTDNEEIPFRASTAAIRHSANGKMLSHSHQSVTFCAVDSRYNVVVEAAKSCNMRVIAHEDDQSNIYWLDVSTITERFSRLAPWQRINHFPGMSHISRKNRLAQNLGKMQRRFPKEYAYYPKTWVLPQDAKDFRAEFDGEGQAGRGTTYIIKPENSSKGRGIFLSKSLEPIALFEPQVAQVYINRPLLIDDFKFDIRMYVLVTRCQPLCMYKYSDGLVRLCTVEYSRPNNRNMKDKFMHLTNAAINRFSDNYALGDVKEQNSQTGTQNETGSKRSLKWFLKWIEERYGEAAGRRLWQLMGELCVKTVISILPTLVRDYKAVFGKDSTGEKQNWRSPSSKNDVNGSRAFEILGVDVLIDQRLKPWLIEVNTLPSFATDSPVDVQVKRDLIEQTLKIIQAKASDQQSFEEHRKAQAAERLLRHRYRTEARLHAFLDEGNVVLQTRRRIERLFQEHAPDRMHMVSELMDKNKGREASLLRRLTKHFSGQGVSISQPHSASPSSIVDDSAETDEVQTSRPASSVSFLSSSSYPSMDSSPTPSNLSENSSSTHVGNKSENFASNNRVPPSMDEGAILKSFERIYPVPEGAVDIYAHLMQFVWERENKLLRGKLASIKNSDPSLPSTEDPCPSECSSTTGVGRCQAMNKERSGNEHDGEKCTSKNEDEKGDDKSMSTETSSSESSCWQPRKAEASLDALLATLLSDESKKIHGAHQKSRRRYPISSTASQNSSRTVSSSMTGQKVAAERLMRGLCSSGQCRDRVHDFEREGAIFKGWNTSPCSTIRFKGCHARTRQGYEAVKPTVVDLASLVTF